MASKEVMITAPVVILLYDRIFLSGSWRETWQRRGRIHAALMATWLLLAYLMISSSITARDVGTDGQLSWGTYVATEFQVVVSYLKRCLWPHPLIFYYGPELYRAASDWVSTLVCAGLLALLAGGSVVLSIRGRPLGFVGLVFFLLLAPTSSVVPLARQPMAESRVYCHWPPLSWRRWWVDTCWWVVGRFFAS